MVAEIFRSITEERPSKKKKKLHEKAYLKKRGGIYSNKDYIKTLHQVLK